MGLLAAALLATGAAGPLAEPAVVHPDGPPHVDIAEPARPIPNFDITNLDQVLDALGLAHETRAGSDGEKFIAVSIGDTVSFNLVPTACLDANQGRCIGLNTIALFAGSARPQALSAFNQKYIFSSVGVIGNGEGLYLLRYDIADYGIPRGNLAASLATFVTLLEIFRDTLAASPKSVRFEGYASDLAADRLNRQSAAAAGVSELTALPAADVQSLAEALFAAGAPVNAPLGDRHADDGRRP